MIFFSKSLPLIGKSVFFKRFNTGGIDFKLAFLPFSSKNRLFLEKKNRLSSYSNTVVNFFAILVSYYLFFLVFFGSEFFVFSSTTSGAVNLRKMDAQAIRANFRVRRVI